MSDTTRIVTASTPQLMESRINAHLDDGWQLAGPVQATCGADTDGGWNVLMVATLVRDVEVSGPVGRSGEVTAGGTREYPPLPNAIVVDSPRRSQRAEFDGDRLVGPDQARETFWEATR